MPDLYLFCETKFRDLHFLKKFESLSNLDLWLKQFWLKSQPNNQLDAQLFPEIENNFYLTTTHLSNLPVSFEYFKRYKTTSPCLALEFKSGSTNTQNIIALDNDNKLEESINSNDLADGFQFANLIFFKRNNWNEVSDFLANQKLCSFSFLPCPAKEGTQKALFLDRDGIINEDKGYVAHEKDLVFKPGVVSFLKHALKLNYTLHVLTNQSGIARNFYNEEQMQSLHRYIEQQLLKESIVISSWSYSPYHYKKGEGIYKKYSHLRKPRAGMILDLASKYSIDFENSYMLGDKVSDCLNFAGVNYYHLQGQYDLSLAKGTVVKSFDEIIKILS